MSIHRRRPEDPDIRGPAPEGTREGSLDGPKAIGVNYIDRDDNYIDRKSGLIINIISSLFSAFAGYFFAPARILREQPDKMPRQKPAIERSPAHPYLDIPLEKAVAGVFWSSRSRRKILLLPGDGVCSLLKSAAAEAR
jgi:hypothetical protein